MHVCWCENVVFHLPERGGGDVVHHLNKGERIRRGSTVITNTLKEEKHT